MYPSRFMCCSHGPQSSTFESWGLVSRKDGVTGDHYSWKGLIPVFLHFFPCEMGCSNSKMLEAQLNGTKLVEHAQGRPWVQSPYLPWLLSHSGFLSLRVCSSTCAPYFDPSCQETLPKPKAPINGAPGVGHSVSKTVRYKALFSVECSSLGTSLQQQKRD